MVTSRAAKILGILFSGFLIILNWMNRIADFFGIIDIPKNVRDALYLASNWPLIFVGTIWVIAVGCLCFLVFDTLLRNFSIRHLSTASVIVMLGGFFIPYQALLLSGSDKNNEKPILEKSEQKEPSPTIRPREAEDTYKNLEAATALLLYNETTRELVELYKSNKKR